MVWHIKKTSIMGSELEQFITKVIIVGQKPYADRSTYTSQAKAKAENYIWEKKTSNGWDVTAVK